jgi:hypothetical protein
VARSEFHCLKIMVDTEISEPTTGELPGFWNGLLAACGLLPGGIKSSDPGQGGSINFLCLLPPAGWFSPGKEV